MEQEMIYQVNINKSQQGDKINIRVKIKFKVLNISGVKRDYFIWRKSIVY